MDIRDLRYFRAAAEYGHLGLAAESLRLTQPAITKSIRRLESEIDGKLFAPDGRRLRLTAAGKLLLARARIVDSSLQQTIRDVQREARGEAARVRLGASPLVAESLFPRIAAASRRDAPGLVLDLRIRESRQLCVDIAAGEIDMAVVPAPDTPVGDAVVTHLLDDSLVVACAADHPLLVVPQVRHADLCDYDWVLPDERSQVRRHLNDLFLAQGLPQPSCRIEVNSVLAAPGLVGTSQLLAFTSRLSLQAGRFAGMLQELPHAPIRAERRIVLVTCRDVSRDPIKRHTAALIKGEAEAIFRGL